MSASMIAVYVVLVLLSYVVAPVTLIWGWIRWVRLPKKWSISAILALIGFGWATTSALLAISMAAYARVHYFAFYDPLLMRIFRLGFLLSLAGIAFGIGGVWRNSPLRWHALAGAVGTFAFWMLAAAGE